MMTPLGVGVGFLALLTAVFTAAMFAQSLGGAEFTMMVVLWAAGLLWLGLFLLLFGQIVRGLVVVDDDLAIGSTIGAINMLGISAAIFVAVMNLQASWP